MKKKYFLTFVIFLCVFIFGHSKVNALDVDIPINVTYDMTNNSNFNIFYEMNKSSNFAQMLAENGVDFLTYLISLSSPNDIFLGNSQYSNRNSYYSIFTSSATDYKKTLPTGAVYMITLNTYSISSVAVGGTYSVYTKSAYYFFDSSSKFISMSQDYNYTSSESKYSNILPLDFNYHPEYYFEYFAGDMQFYNPINKLYNLKYLITDDGKHSITNDGDSMFFAVLAVLSKT